MSGFLDRLVLRALGTARVAHRRREPLFAAVAPRAAEAPLGASDEGDARRTGRRSPVEEELRDLGVRARMGAAYDAARASADSSDQTRRTSESASPSTMRLVDGAAFSASASVEDELAADGSNVVDELHGADAAVDSERIVSVRSRARDQIAGVQGTDQGSFSRRRPLDGEDVDAGDRFDAPDDTRSSARAFDLSRSGQIASDGGSDWKSSRFVQSRFALDAPERAADAAAARSAEALASIDDRFGTTGDRSRNARADLVANRRVFDRAETGSNDTEGFSPADLRSREWDERGNAREPRAPVSTHDERDGRDTRTGTRGADAELTINVSIGRIDVARPVPAAAAAAPSRPQRTLSDYMNLRAKVRGR